MHFKIHVSFSKETLLAVMSFLQYIINCKSVMKYNRYIVIHQLVRACIIAYNTYVCIKMWPDFGKTTSYAQGYVYIELCNSIIQ